MPLNCIARYYFTWLWYSFKVTVIWESRKIWAHFFTNFLLDFDETWYAAMPCWCVQAHATFLFCVFVCLLVFLFCFVFVFLPNIQGKEYYLVVFISRVPDQNGISQLYNMLEMYHSGPEPSVWNMFKNGLCLDVLNRFFQTWCDERHD